MKLMNDKILFVWDFHGVLEKDNEKAVQELCNFVLKKYGINREMTLEETLDWYGLSWFDYFKLLIPDGDPELWQSMVKRTLSLQQIGWDIVKKHIKPQDYSEEVLKIIKDKGHHSIVLSNSRPAHAKRFANVVGLTDYLNEIIGADSDDNSRIHNNPNINKEIHDIKTEILNNFLKNKNYKKVVAIGDKESDIRAGKNCGAVTYLFFNSEVKKNAHNTKADYTISDLREVLKELD